MAWRAALYDNNLKSYQAIDDRQVYDTVGEGAGVVDIGDLKVSAGSGMNSSVAAGRGLVRGSFATGQGMYLVNHTSADSYQHAAADPSNPRIDQLVAKVYDQADGGDTSDNTTGLIVPGVAAVGATLDNRTGAGSFPSNSLLLADVLVPAGAASAAAFTYRDRRVYTGPGITPQVLGAVGPGIALLAAPGLGATVSNSGNLPSGNQTAVVLTWLPRRIMGATRLRWVYLQPATPSATTYNFALFDTSGRKVLDTGSVALAGAALSSQARAETFSPSPVTLEAGLYYLLITTATNVNPVTAFNVLAPSSQNVPDMVYLRSASLVGAVPSTLQSSTLTDSYAVSPAFTPSIPLPVFTQS